MEFPVVKELDRNDINKTSLEELVTTPSLHVIDAREFEENELSEMILLINKNKYLLFPYGMLIFIRPDQKTSLQKTKRPPLVHFVESVEEKEVFIENFYQSRKNAKNSSSLYELLLGQTWAQIQDKENKKLLSEMSKWKKKLQDLEKENSVYEFLNKHI